jgi:hypothetical protein
LGDDRPALLAIVEMLKGALRLVGAEASMHEAHDRRLVEAAAQRSSTCA